MSQYIDIRFPDKLFKFLEEKFHESLSWSECGLYVVIEKNSFTRTFLEGTMFFKTSNFSSIVRQFNLYRFRKVPNKQRKVYKGDFVKYYHENFRRDGKNLLNLVRRTSASSRTSNYGTRRKDYGYPQETRKRRCNRRKHRNANLHRSNDARKMGAAYQKCSVSPSFGNESWSPKCNIRTRKKPSSRKAKTSATLSRLQERYRQVSHWQTSGKLIDTNGIASTIHMKEDKVPISSASMQHFSIKVEPFDEQNDFKTVYEENYGELPNLSDINADPSEDRKMELKSETPNTSSFSLEKNNFDTSLSSKLSTIKDSISDMVKEIKPQILTEIEASIQHDCLSDDSIRVLMNLDKNRIIMYSNFGKCDGEQLSRGSRASEPNLYSCENDFVSVKRNSCSGELIVKKMRMLSLEDDGATRRGVSLDCKKRVSCLAINGNHGVTNFLEPDDICIGSLMKFWACNEGVSTAKLNDALGLGLDKVPSFDSGDDYTFYYDAIPFLSLDDDSDLLRDLPPPRDMFGSCPYCDASKALTGSCACEKGLCFRSGIADHRLN